jgi:chromosome segregation ATPase
MTTFADVRWVVEGESDPNARIAELERALAQEKARNAELGEQLRAAREATREAVDREGALVTQRNYARDKVERLERWLASAKALHLEDVGRLSKCLEVRDARVAELERLVEGMKPAKKPIDMKWVREQWQAALEVAERKMVAEYPQGERHSDAARALLYFVAALDFEQRMGWWK